MIPKFLLYRLTSVDWVDALGTVRFLCHPGVYESLDGIDTMGPPTARVTHAATKGQSEQNGV